MELTHEKLKQLLHYDEATGIFTWLASRRRPDTIGKPAGSLNSKGYVLIVIDGRKYKASRLAYFYMTGSLPAETVDHIDENKANNAWKNLRHASKAQNTFNQPIRSTNKSGVKGVVWRERGRYWVAQVRKGSRRAYKEFPEHMFESACEFARKWREELHGEFANHGGGCVVLVGGDKP